VTCFRAHPDVEPIAEPCGFAEADLTAEQQARFARAVGDAPADEEPTR
jgi:hypothetical protein